MCKYNHSYQSFAADRRIEASPNIESVYAPIILNYTEIECAHLPSFSIFILAAEWGPWKLLSHVTTFFTYYVTKHYVAC